jgi:hypothetical protein
MNRKQRAMQDALLDTLVLSLGFTGGEADSLRRISMTLRRWHELECGADNGVIERDENTGAPYWRNHNHSYLSANDPRARIRIADRKMGALRRLAAIMAARNDRESVALSHYVQTDPRGAALYLIRPGDVPAGADVGSYYSRGVCVY